MLYVDGISLRTVKGNGGNIIPRLLYVQETISLLGCH